MRRTLWYRYDSFKAAKDDFKPLFEKVTRPRSAYSGSRGSTFTTPSPQLDELVGKYLLYMPRKLQNSKYPSQRRSWLRTNASLIFSESRQQRNYLVAQAALKVALRETDHFPQVEQNWIHDALASCTSLEELKQIEKVLRESVRELTVEETTPVRALEAREAAVAAVLSKYSFLQSDLAFTHEADGGSVLGDSTAEEEAAVTLAVMEKKPEAGEKAPVLTENSVALAVASSRPQATGETLLSAEKRGQAVLRQLQRQRESVTVSPNHSFSRYFLKQRLVTDEGELQSMVQAMRERRSRVGLRIQGTHPHAEAARVLLSASSLIRPISFLPSVSNAYQLDCGPEVPFSQLLADRNLVESLTKEGVVSYQSISSMLPVYYLDLREGDRVLDLCAAPGGKTLLAQDYLGGRRGGVIANEANPDRARQLADRLDSLSPHISTLCSDGAHIVSRSPTAKGAFNKILVDVPCSGEGRLSREPLAWRLWHPRRGLEFFPRQLALLRQAMELCAVGGTVVYSTCTLNPIENEAVVAAVLREWGPSVQLEAPPALQGPSEERPLLSRGLKEWYVPTPGGGFYRDYKEALTRQEEPRERLELPHDTFFHYFPPSEEEMETIARPLQLHSRRVMPHRSSGLEGFYMAMIRKVGSHPLTKGIGPSGLQEDTRREMVPRKGSRGFSLEAAAAKAVLTSDTPTLWHQCGYLPLHARSALVLQYLKPFFEFVPREETAAVKDSVSAEQKLSSFLDYVGVRTVWKDGEGMRLISEASLEVFRVMKEEKHHAVYDTHFNTDEKPHHLFFYSPQKLLQVGLLLLDGSGAVTEKGAHYLWPFLRAWSASTSIAQFQRMLSDLPSGGTQRREIALPRRTLRLPFRYLQVLLSSRQLYWKEDFIHGTNPHLSDPEKRAVYEMSNQLIRGQPGEEKREGSQESSWLTELVRSLPHPPRAEERFTYSAIATVRGEDKVLQESRVDGRAVRDWALPVTVEVHQRMNPLGGRRRVLSLRVRLQLSSTSRDRYVAMLGRLLAVPRLKEKQAHRPLVSSPTPTQPPHQTEMGETRKDPVGGSRTTTEASVAVDKDRTRYPVSGQGSENRPNRGSTVFEI